MGLQDPGRLRDRPLLAAEDSVAGRPIIVRFVDLPASPATVSRQSLSWVRPKGSVMRPFLIAVMIALLVAVVPGTAQANEYDCTVGNTVSQARCMVFCHVDLVIVHTINGDPSPHECRIT